MAAFKLTAIILVSLGCINAASLNEQRFEKRFFGGGSLVPSLPLPVALPSIPAVPGVPKVPGVPAPAAKATASGGAGLFGVGLPSVPGLDVVTNPTSLLDPSKALSSVSKMTDVLPGPLKQMLPGPLNPDNVKGLEFFAGAVDKQVLADFLNPMKMAGLVANGDIKPQEAVKLVKLLTSGSPDIAGLMALGANNKMIDQMLVAPMVRAGGFMIGKGLADGSLWKMLGSGTSFLSFFG